MPKNRFILRRPFSYTYKRTAIFIIFINFLIFGLQVWNRNLYYLIYNFGAMNPVNVETNRMYWQFFTYMFVHGSFRHVLFNMLALLIFGLNLEKAIGSKEFLLFYLLCGTLSGFFSFLFYKFTGQYNVMLLGASGAVYAILFAYAVFFPKSIILIWGIVPVPAPILVLIYTLIELGSQFFDVRSSVAHMTHLFGFFAAWLYFVIRMGVHPIKIWKDTYR
ncbi:MAG: rhomboid family intramembrane serine protease [Treponema sp.]|nr:rhomboid family intramembrane serine protease [Treponema sp.]